MSKTSVASAPIYFNETNIAHLLLKLTPAFISLCFGLSYGFNYGINNQNSYLLRALQLFDSTLLSKDWLLSKTDFHPIFSYFVWPLYEIHPDGLAFAVVNVIVTAMQALALYWIISLLADREYRIPVFLLLMAISMTTGSQSVGASYLFSKVLQPSTVATLGYLAAFLYFLKGRFVYSGLFLALGNLFHANFLILSFPLFFLSHFLLGRNNLGERLLRQFGFSIIAALPVLGFILTSAFSPDAEAAREILLEARSRHHYLPSYFWIEFLPFLGWQILGIAALRQLDISKELRARLYSLLISMTVLIWGATLLTTIVYIPDVAQLYFWRLAPFCDIFFQILVCVALVHFLAKSVFRSYTKRLGLIFSFSFLIWMVGTAQPIKERLGAIRWIQNFGWESWVHRGYPKEESDLYRWVSRTPADAVFLIPPRMENFRLHARRAVVVDWKSMPAVPSEILEWYTRIETITGIPDVVGGAAASKGYSRMGEKRLQRIREKYGIHYAVFRKNLTRLSLSNQEIAFENEGFVVVSF